MKEFLRSWVPCFLVGLIVFGVYFKTTSPALGHGHDTCELTVAAVTLGIPHPPGYPVYTRLGHLWNQLIPWGEPHFKMNLFSGFAVAVGSIFFTRAIAKVTGHWFYGAVASLLFAFCRTIWRQSVIAEVFSLHWFYLCFYFWLAGCWAEADDRRRAYIVGLTCFLMGTNLGHHHTIIFALPGLFVYGILKKGGSHRKWGFTYYVVPLLLLGWLPFYFDIMYRAQGKPFLNWGDPCTPELVRDQFLRRAYGTFQLSASGEPVPGAGVAHCVAFFVSFANSQLPMPICMLTLFSVFCLRRPHLRDSAVLLWLWFLVQGPFFALYARQPPQEFFIDMQERFYGAAYLGAAGLAGLSLSLIGDWLKERGRFRWIYLGAALPLASMLYNWRWCSEADYYQGYDSIKGSYSFCAPGAMYIVDGDFACGAFEYLQAVEGFRQDAPTIIPGVIGSPWGRQNLPGYLQEAMNLGAAGNEKTLEIAMRAQHRAGKDVMLGMKADIPGQFLRRGLLWQWLPLEAKAPSEKEELKNQVEQLRKLKSLPRRGSFYETRYQGIWVRFSAGMWISGIRYIAEHTYKERPDVALEALQFLEEFVPLSPLDRVNQGHLSKRTGKYRNACWYFMQALELEPNNRLAVAGMYDLCLTLGQPGRASVWRTRLRNTR